MKEIITKENYANHLAEVFNKNQVTLNDYIDRINNERNYTCFEELKDITPRFFNATTNGVRYFSEHNINYYESFETNQDKIAIEAWEFYVKSKYSEAINELVYLYNDICRINNEITNSKEYKSRVKQRDIYSFLCFKMPNTMGLVKPITKRIKALNAISYKEYFEECKKHIQKYNELAESIYSLDPKKDIIDIFKYYLDAIYAYTKEKTFNENTVENNKIQNSNINYAFKSLSCLLVKLGKKNEVNDLAKHYLELIEIESINRLNDFKVQYEEFRKSISENNHETIIQEPKKRTLFNKKSNSK